MSTMLYMAPGEHFIHGEWFDYIITDDDPESIEQAIVSGWSLTTGEALARREVEKRQLDAIAEAVADGAVPMGDIEPAPMPLDDPLESPATSMNALRRKPGRPRKEQP